MQEFARKFYASKAWQDCRAGFIAERVKIDGGMCQCCHDSVGYIVHHVIELNPYNIDDADIALNWDRLRYVCHECHNKIHEVFLGRQDYMFDANGNFISLGNRVIY